MNNEFIDTLWAAAYKLRGASDMPELCRLMIFAMFIKYIDLENTKDEDPCMQSYDDRFSVGYLALTYGKKVSADRLIEYINNIDCCRVERTFGKIKRLPVTSDFQGHRRSWI